MQRTENIHAKLGRSAASRRNARNESRELIAADLRMLISQIETTMRRTATAMDQEHGSDPEGSADVFVLDDVTPRYATAIDALDACRASLGNAPECLSDAGSTV